MSRSLNRVSIIGNVGGEPRLTVTNFGTPVCNFSVATNRSWRPRGSTERREETQWHYVVAFGRLAEKCSQILTRGTKVFVMGRLQNREFVEPTIVASEVIATDRRKKEVNGQQQTI